MHTLYDSESFSVTHVLANAGELVRAAQDATAVAPPLARHGFEIIDKRVGREVYLDGSWAELFQQQISAWRDQAPTQEEIEQTLEGYAALAHTPVLLH